MRTKRGRMAAPYERRPRKWRRGEDRRLGRHKQGHTNGHPCGTHRRCAPYIYESCRIISGSAQHPTTPVADSARVERLFFRLRVRLEHRGFPVPLRQIASSSASQPVKPRRVITTRRVQPRRIPLLLQTKSPRIRSLPGFKESSTFIRKSLIPELVEISSSQAESEDLWIRVCELLGTQRRTARLSSPNGIGGDVLLREEVGTSTTFTTFSHENSAVRTTFGTLFLWNEAHTRTCSTNSGGSS